MNSSRILPATAYVNDTLIGYCSGNDSDGDNVSYYYEWFVGGVANASGVTSSNYTQATEVNVANVSSDLAKGQQWVLSCLASDDAVNSSWLNSSALTITNYPPSISSVSISPASPVTTDDLNCSVSGWSDIDGDGAQYYFQWYNGSTLILTAGPTGTAWNVLNYMNLSNGDTWNCTVTPYDGEVNGSSLTAQVSITQGCGTLSAPNTLLTLSSNLSISGSTCFTIAADNVTLDCDGHNITGNNSTSTYGVYSTKYNTTVKNCYIYNFDGGIYYNGATYGHIDNVFVNVTCNNYGVPIYGSAIAVMYNSNNNVVSNSSAYSRYGIGLFLGGVANNNSLLNVTLYSGAKPAADINRANYTVVDGLYATAAIHDAAYFATSIGIKAYNMNLTTSGGGRFSLSLYDLKDSLFANSTLRSTGSGSYNIYLSGAGGSSSSDNNVFANLTLINYGLNDLTRIVYGENNTFYWNNFTDTGGRYVDDYGSTNKYNTTIDGKGEGNIWYDVITGAALVSGTVNSSYAPLLIGASGDNYTYNDIHSSFKLNSPGTDYAPLTNRTNTAPVMTAASIQPDPAYKFDSLEGYCTATDAEGGIWYYYEWFLDGDSYSSGISAEHYSSGVEALVSTISPALAKGQNWTFGCLATDNLTNSSWLNSTNLTISNTPPPKVTLQYPDSGNGSFINLSPRFNWSEAVDADGDPVTYSILIGLDSGFSTVVLNQTGIGNNYYDYADELEFTTYYWKAQANDGEENGEWSDTWNFTVQPYVSIQMLNANVSFETQLPNTTNDTTTDNPLPFIFKSNSNVYINMTGLNISDDLWTTQPTNTSYWQLRVRTKSNDGSFDEGASKMDWFNATNTTNVIMYLNYSAAKSNVSLDTNVTVPVYEDIGVKSSSLEFIWEAAT
jgi:hypothetical protein